MKNTGIVRKLDSLGRITLPIETRRTLGLKEREPLEMYTEGDTICLRAYKPEKACAHCGSIDEVVTVGESHICKQCLDKFNKSL